MSINKDQLDGMDEAIRTGLAHEVARTLGQLKLARVPREFRMRLANISRRVGKLSLGLKLLSPIIYPGRSRAGLPVTPKELSEYAVLLTRSGLHREALELLDRVNESEAPEALLYRAYVHFEQWSFGPTLPILLKYVNSDITEYQRLVGRVNLAYALISCGRHDESLALLKENLSLCEKGGHTVLKANCHELLTRLHIQRRDFAQAAKFLDTASMLMGASDTNENRLIQKWSAVLTSMKERDLNPLLEYRKGITGIRDSEFLREVDRFSLWVESDPARFNFLVFGTCSSEYREAVYQEIAQRPHQSSYVFGALGAPLMDLLSGEIDGVQAIEAGGKCHSLLEFLLRDFYRPFKLGELHAGLFPGERYNIHSSPNRVRQIVHRTRQWIQERSLPISITEQQGYYSLRIAGPFSFLVPLDRLRVDGYRCHFEQLRMIYGTGQTFQPHEARRKLSLPRTTFFRLAQWAVREGLLERLGSFNSVQYRISELNHQQSNAIELNRKIA
jgi:tetratricopeptide (TPR) repeat protein